MTDGQKTLVSTLAYGLGLLTSVFAFLAAMAGGWLVAVLWLIATLVLAWFWWPR